MDSELFAPARDSFYLAAVLLGSGAGCILNRFRKKSTARSRDSSVTAGLVFFSGAVAALTASTVFSGWAVFRETGLYLPAGVFAAVSIAAFRFPRAAGFPVLLALGVFAVWNAYICLVFPPAGSSPLVRVDGAGGGRAGVKLAAPPGTESGARLSFQPDGEGAVLEFRVLCVSYSRFFPLAGGAERALAVEIRYNGGLVYADPRPGRKFPPVPGLPDSPRGENTTGWGPFISVREVSARLETGTLIPGLSPGLVFEGPDLVFR